MPLYTVVVERSYCEKCGGMGTIDETIPCDACDNYFHIDDEDYCEVCDGLKVIVVNETPCKFCSVGDTDLHVYQIECRDIDVCVALIKGKLTKEFQYDEHEWEDDTPVRLDNCQNVWGLVLNDINQYFWCNIVQTEKLN